MGYPVRVDFSPIQIAMVLVIALIVFGPSRLPDLGRQLGRGIREAKKQMSELGDEMTRAADAPAADAATTTTVTPAVATAPDPTSSTAGTTTAVSAADDLLDGVIVSGVPTADAPAATADTPSGTPSDADLLEGVIVSGGDPPPSSATSTG